MARKVFISVLGAGFYEECNYTLGEFESGKLRFVQEATLLQIGAKNWSVNDTAIFVLTSKAQSENWDSEIKNRIKFGNEKIEYEGLEKRINNLKLPFKYQILQIPDGVNEEEMWDIFQKIFYELNENDELYFDLTHAFRYLPMLVLVLSNYSKFLKNIEIKQISYGNFEARDLKSNNAPIVNLTSLSVMQDWTFAAANYLENGNADKLIHLCNTSLLPILREAKGRDSIASNLNTYVKGLQSIIDERRMCRGKSIIESNNVKKVKDIAKLLPHTFIKPFNPVFEKINQSLDNFEDKVNVNNGFEAAKWCNNNGLYQQAITILFENIITSVCILESLDWKTEKSRAIVSTGFHIHFSKISDDDWQIPNSWKKSEKDEMEFRNTVKKIIQSDILIQLSNDFNIISALRNDFNHSGMRNNPLKPKDIEEKINFYVENIPRIINKDSITIDNN